MDSSAGYAELTARLRAAGCVFAEDEARALLLTATGPEHLESMVLRRVVGVPLEHVVGWVDFGGVRLEVGPQVFVPRQRTRLLARVAAQELAQAVTRAGERSARSRTSRLLDLCCGVGPVSAAVLAATDAVEVVATDIDPAATALAARNLHRHPSALAVTGDLFGAVPAGWRGTVDVVAANAPYVPSSAVATMPPEARDHEPLLALDGGDDGLDVHRAIAAQVGGWLRPGGCLVVEVWREQVDALLAVVQGVGLRAEVVEDAELDATVVTARGTLGAGP